MNLYLMRHSDALSKAQAKVSVDADRPLSKEGIANANKMAKKIKELTKGDIQVFSSPLLRARETSKLVLDAIGYEYEAEIINLLDPINVPCDFIEELFSRNIKKDVLAVGHYPHLGNIASCLVGAENIPQDFILEPAGFFMIELPGYPASKNARIAGLANPNAKEIITRL
jgi:phosphohistidine phosphatase